MYLTWEIRLNRLSSENVRRRHKSREQFVVLFETKCNKLIVKFNTKKEAGIVVFGAQISLPTPTPGVNV